MFLGRYSNNVRRLHVKLLIQLKFYNVVWEGKMKKTFFMSIKIVK